jgi:hypothetical protein
MGGLTEFFNYREKIMEKVLKDDLLLRALGNSSIEALTQDAPDIDDLRYTQVFPYRRNDSQIESEVKNYLMFELAASGTDNTGFYSEISLTFYVMVHQTMDRIDKQGQIVLRADYLIYRLEELFKESRGFGIGKLNFKTVRPLITPANFYGLASIYTTTDFG